MDGKQISLGQRILNLENLRKVINCTVGTVQRKSSLVLETPGSVHPDRDAFTLVLALGHCLDIFKVANCPSKELSPGKQLASQIFQVDVVLEILT